MEFIQIKIEMDFRYFVCAWLILCRNINTVIGEKNTETFRMTDRVYMCSKWLSSLIFSFCNNDYRIVKRDTSLLMDKLMPKDPYKNMNFQSSDQRRWRRLRRQVASECCERPCTVENILRYCPEDAKVLQENPHIFEKGKSS